MTAKIICTAVCASLAALTACAGGDDGALYDLVAREYVEICFDLDAHVPGLIDAYYGPEEFRSEAEERGTVSIDVILEKIAHAREELQKGESDPNRKQFLLKQLTALRTLAVIAQSGTESMTFESEVQNLYDIEPRRVPESEYESALRTIDGLLPGEGGLLERLDRYRERLVIPEDRIVPLFTAAAEDARRRTHAVLPLPEYEEFTIEAVTGKSWSGYNWFQGNGRSLIQLNLDLPRRMDQALPLMTHEGYPGHHTEYTLREKILYRDKGYLEYSIYPLYSPQSVVSEGLAESAIDIVYTDDEIVEYMRTSIAPEIGLEDFDYERWRRIESAVRTLASVPGNAAVMLFVERRSEDEVVDYLRRYGMISEEYARKRLDFIKEYRGYIFTYYYGHEILKPLFEKGNAVETYREIVSNPAFPSMFTGVDAKPPETP